MNPPIPPDPWQLVIAQYALPGITIFAGIAATLKVFFNKLRRDMLIMVAALVWAVLALRRQRSSTAP